MEAKRIRLVDAGLKVDISIPKCTMVERKRTCELQFSPVVHSNMVKRLRKNEPKASGYFFEKSWTPTIAYIAVHRPRKTKLWATGIAALLLFVRYCQESKRASGKKAQQFRYNSARGNQEQDGGSEGWM